MGGAKSSVWIGKDLRLDRRPPAPRPLARCGEKSQSRRMQWFQPVYVGLN
jgi:hypothetical protein